MTKRNFGFTIITILMFSSTALSQERDNVELKGEVVDNLFKPIPFVSIVSKTKGLGTISRENGKFNIRVSLNDTLQFSSLSYRKKEIPVNQLVIGEYYIVLEKNMFLLGDVNVMELRWQDFKEKVMNTEVKREDQTKLQIKDLPNIFQKRVELSPYAGNTNPLSLALTYFKKENIRKRKQKRWRKIYRKSWITKE